MICIKCQSETSDFRPKRKKCRSCERAEHRQWHHDNRDAILPDMRQRSRAYYAANRERLICYSVDKNKKNKAKRRIYCAKNLRKQRAEVSTAYAKRCLAESMRISYKDVPATLVAVHQQYIRLRRALNEKL